MGNNMEQLGFILCIVLAIAYCIMVHIAIDNDYNYTQMGIKYCQLKYGDNYSFGWSSDSTKFVCRYDERKNNEKPID